MKKTSPYIPYTKFEPLGKLDSDDDSLDEEPITPSPPKRVRRAANTKAKYVALYCAFAVPHSILFQLAPKKFPLRLRLRRGRI